MHSKIILDIRAVLAKPNMPVEFFVDLATEYNNACEMVNGRLEKIRGLLSVGCRDEAVQLADQLPQLLNQVSLLDFPELEQWRTKLAELSLETPPTLMLEVAEQLEVAYDELQQLEPLLRSHRLLALAQAPLQSRIQILRMLRSRDPMNPIWATDTELLETARIGQIAKEFRAAHKRNDAPTLQALHAELKQPWSVPVPRTLKASVAGSSASLVKGKARKEMKSLVKRLNDSLLEFDAAGARPLRDQWNQLNQTAKLRPDDPLAVAIAEPLAWLQDLDQQVSDDKAFDAAIHGLEQAVQNRKSLDKLDRAYFKVQKHEREIPELLLHQFGLYREDLLVTKKRTFTLRVGALAGVLLVIAGVAFWFIQAQSARRSLEAARSQMAAFNTENDYEAGGRYFDSLEPTAQTDAEVLRSHSELLAKEAVETDRRERFQEVVAQVDLQGPLDFTLDAVMKEAKSLAVTDSEKSELELLKNGLYAARSERLNQRNQAFLKSLQPLQTQIQTTIKQPAEAISVDSLSELVAKVQRLVEGQHGSVDGKPSISPAIRQTADGIVVQGKARLREISRADEASKKIGQLVGEMRKLDRYAASLKMFADRFEMNPNAADFTLSAEEAGLWSGFKDWQLIASQIKQIPLEKIAPQDAERWFTRIKLANQTLQLVNWRESANALGVYLGKKKEVGLPAEPRLLNRITDTLSQPLFADIDVVPRNDGLFYLAGKTGTRFTHFLPDGKTGSEAFKQGESSSKAPHCQVVNALLDKLNSSSSVPADKLVFELLDIVLASEADESKSVDPLVTCELLNQILLFGKYVAPVIRGFSDAQRGKLREAGVVGIDWRVFDDKNGEVTIARRESPSAIAQIRTQFATIKDTSSAVEFSPELCLQWTEVADYEVVGFLYRTGQAWGIDSNRLLQDGEGLYCLIPQPDKVVAVSRVGDYASGTIANTPDTSLLQAGRIVYSRKTEQNK